jgi:predicted PurR-regulated permease PerM
MVTGFVNGQLILAIIASMFAFFALLISSTLFDVSINAVALAGIVAIFGLIPLIGNPLAATIVIIACLFNSVGLALVMLIYFIVYSQIENVTLQPYIQSKANDLTPLVVFVSALIGIGFGGILGALVAVPIAGCIKILVEDYFANRTVEE